MFVKWRNAFLWKRVKSEEFNNKQCLKNRERKGELFEHLKQYADRKRYKKMLSQGARQQYIYKLGQRVLASLQRNKNESIAKNHLLDLLKVRIQTKRKEQLLNAMASYTIYRRRRL